MKLVINRWSSSCLACVVLLVSLMANAQEQGVVRPQIVMREIVQAMPRREKQEVRAAMMPPQVNMTGYNRSNSDPLRLVAFYVSDPDTPFLDPIQSR